MIETFLLLMGSFIMVAGAVGVLRFPDVYTRLHASTKCDTGGAMSILLGAALQIDMPVHVRLKLIILVFLIALINPMVSHAIARGAHRGGVKPDVTFDMYERDSD